MYKQLETHIKSELNAEGGAGVGSRGHFCMHRKKGQGIIVYTVQTRRPIKTNYCTFINFLHFPDNRLS